MKPSALGVQAATAAAGLTPTAALAHGGEIFLLSAAQLLFGVVAAMVLIPLPISRRRKVRALVGFAVGVPLAWAVMFLLPMSMASIFLVPFAIPLGCLGLVLLLTRVRVRASEHGA